MEQHAGAALGRPAERDSIRTGFGWSDADRNHWLGLLVTDAAADPLRDDEAFCSMMRALSAFDGKATPPATGAPVSLPPFLVAIKSAHEAATLPW